MNKAQRMKLIEYLESDKNITSINYLKDSSVYSDNLSIYFHATEGKDKFMFSAEIKPNGRETITKRAKVYS
jgi:hypothetical protein